MSADVPGMGGHQKRHPIVTLPRCSTTVMERNKSNGPHVAHLEETCDYTKLIGQT